MKKYLEFIIIYVLLVFSQSSCKKDFLDVPDRTLLLRQAYITDLKSLGEYMNGVYVNNASQFMHGMYTVYGDLVADNLKPATGVTLFSSQYAWNQQETDGPTGLGSTSAQNLNAIWYYGYKIIRDCSFVLENIEQYRSENPGKADDIKGQALAVRGWVHFMLVNTFAQSYSFTADGSHVGIPYVTTSDWEKAVIRQPVKQVYDALIADLTKSLEFLPMTVTDVRLMNFNAVKAILARACLFKGDFETAKNMACDVISRVPFMTNTPTKKMYPDSLFRKGEVEALFQMYPETTNFFTNFCGRYFRSPIQFIATNDIAAIINERPNDLRKAWITNASPWNVVKYPTNIVPGINTAGVAYYHTLIRSSEMYLTASESYAKIGKDDSARFYLDKIRQRADATAPNSAASGSALLDSIYKERRKELAFEGMRMFDLQRWKKDVNRIDAPNAAAQKLIYPSHKAVAPLPLTDVTISGLTQNESY